MIACPYRESEPFSGFHVKNPQRASFPQMLWVSTCSWVPIESVIAPTLSTSAWREDRLVTEWSRDLFQVVRDRERAQGVVPQVLHPSLDRRVADPGEGELVADRPPVLEPNVDHAPRELRGASGYE